MINVSHRYLLRNIHKGLTESEINRICYLTSKGYSIFLECYSNLTVKSWHKIAFDGNGELIVGDNYQTFKTEKYAQQNN